MQLLVLGMHRSGTSAVTRVLNLMGASIGEDPRMQPPDDVNPRGYWERADVNDLNQEILRHFGCSWYRVSGLEPDQLAGSEAQGFDARAKAILLRLEGNRPWVIKDPRLCVLLPFWRRHLEHPVCVLVYRHPLEVALSLATRDSFPMVFGLALWEQSVRRSLVDAGGLPWVWVSYERLLSDPMATVTKLHRDLAARGVRGLSLPPQAEIEAFLDARLYRSKRDGASDEPSPSQRALWELLSEEPEQLAPERLGDTAPSPWLEACARLLERIEQASSRFAALSREHEEQVAATRDHAQLKLQIAAHVTALRELRAERLALAERMAERAAELLAELEVARHDRETQTAQLADRQREIYQLGGRLERALVEIERWDRLFDRLLWTRRWRLGNRLVGVFRRLTLRAPATPSALAERQELRSNAVELRRGRLEEAGPAGVDGVDRPPGRQDVRPR